jgi:hypothetical protein
MARRSPRRPKADPERAGPFRLRAADKAVPAAEPLVHRLGDGIRCDTERRGHPTPRGRTPFEIRVDASEGFIPLWQEDVTLRWRFQERSMLAFEEPEAAKAAIQELFGEALAAWGDAAPVRFTKQDDNWDFEFVMRPADDCDINGCVLASAFFPDAGRHELVLYPEMFAQDRKEQVDTLIHEVGHVFGLRHFFANLSETRWPSEVFGRDDPFSIMNYGEMSELTDADRDDLARLYRMAWSGELTEINGTPIRLVGPFHDSGVRLRGPAPRLGAGFGGRGVPAMTDGNWDTFFGLVRKLLAAERDLGAHGATDQMRVAASERGATPQLHNFMDIYR